MDDEARQALEAILFVVEQPVDTSTLSQVLEVARVEVEDELRALAASYHQQRRGFTLREVGGGWRLYTAPEADAYVERFLVSGRTTKLSQAALETLAIIAYRQPISRQGIAEIRGVNPDGPVRTLVSRGLVEEVGREAPPRQGALYGTTPLLLERLGLASLDQLPPLAGLLDAGPAPDEPPLDELAATRRRIRAGETWPSPPEGDRADAEDLAQRLEQAARAAMARLQDTLAAVRDEAQGDDE